MHTTNTVREPPFILALDAGGTSTRCVLARANGTVLARSRTGPGNHILSGWEVTRQALADAIQQACAAAHVEPTAIACVLAGSAGVGPNGEGRQLVEPLLQECAPHARVRAVGDMVAAFHGALRGDHGVVIAGGTGSVCYGRAVSGESRQVGGWGHVMGDEGSAYDIAVRGLRAGAYATDGRGPATELTTRIPAALGVRSFIEVAFQVYAQPMDRAAIATLAPTVAEAAAAGDHVAAGVLAEAGHQLGLAVVTTLRALGLDCTPSPVAYMGGVFAAGDAILEPFQRAVVSACPSVTIGPAEFPAVIGAYKLALADLGLPFDAPVAAALQAIAPHTEW